MTPSRILQLLGRHGIRTTPQRVEIAEVLLEKAQHLSAEQIIERLASSGSGVSKATVYNTLNLFAERGLVREITVDPVRKFYDSTTTPHHHFYNVDTRELSDIHEGDVRFAELPPLPEDTEPDGIDVLIRVRSAKR